MLECFVNFFIWYLCDLDEFWIKEMIILYVENMIERLVNLNEE